MKKRLANWLFGIAQKLDPQPELNEKDKPKKLGIGYHITKRDVREYRKHNPQFKSHREALTALIEDVKQNIDMSIFAGLRKNNLISYKVRKTLFVADVIGCLYVYAKDKKEGESDTKD